MFGIYVDGARHDKHGFARAKTALSDALEIWKKNPAKRPEVIVRRLDGQRAVHKLPSGKYRNVEFGQWERVGK